MGYEGSVRSNYVHNFLSFCELLPVPWGTDQERMFNWFLLCPEKLVFRLLNWGFNLGKCFSKGRIFWSSNNNFDPLDLELNLAWRNTEKKRKKTTTSVSRLLPRAISQALSSFCRTRLLPNNCRLLFTLPLPGQSFPESRVRDGWFHCPLHWVTYLIGVHNVHDNFVSPHKGFTSSIKCLLN